MYVCMYVCMYMYIYIYIYIYILHPCAGPLLSGARGYAYSRAGAEASLTPSFGERTARHREPKLPPPPPLTEPPARTMARAP